MENIMDKKIVFTSTETFPLPDEIYEKMLYLLGRFCPYQYSELKEKKPFSASAFHGFFDNIFSALERFFKDERFQQYQQNGPLYAKLYDSLQSEYEKMQIKRKPATKIENMDFIYKVIDFTYRAYKSQEEMWECIDLTCAKKNISANLSYFQTENQIQDFETAYASAMGNRDIQKMKQMLMDANDLVLKEWNHFTTNIDVLQTEEHYSFLGHSVQRAFDGDFRTRFVSCSLYTEKLTDTFRNGFGFILAPKNIVMAASSDLNIDNAAVDTGNLKQFSTVPLVDHPTKIIHQCMQLLEENKKLAQEKNEDRRKVYSEIVVDGFEPIGIFCFTDGSLCLDPNYEGALQLQEKYPNLKIISKDIMKNKQGKELAIMQLNLVNRLYRKWLYKEYGKDRALYALDYEINSLPNFEWFLQAFDDLKQKENYAEEDIMHAFSQNMKLLNITSTYASSLFSGAYTFSEIKYILGKNKRYSVDSILQGNITAYHLSKLVMELSSVNANLDLFYPGLCSFLKTASFVPITEEDAEKIKKEKVIDFDTMTSVLKQKYISNIQSGSFFSRPISKNTKDELSFALCEEKRIFANKEQYEYYIKIKEYASFIDKIQKDYFDLIQETTVLTLDKKELEEEKGKLTEKLTAIQNQIEMVHQSTYDKSDQGIYMSEKMGKMQSDLQTLQKHRFFHWKQIREYKKKMKEASVQRQGEEEAFSIRQKTAIDFLSTTFSHLQMQIDSIYEKVKAICAREEELQMEKENIDQKIKAYYDTDSIIDAKKRIEDAQLFLESYDIQEILALPYLQERIHILTSQMVQEENQIMQNSSLLDDFDDVFKTM